MLPITCTGTSSESGSWSSGSFTIASLMSCICLTFLPPLPVIIQYMIIHFIQSSYKHGTSESHILAYCDIITLDSCELQCL